jgi:hypothetical protein
MLKPGEKKRRVRIKRGSSERHKRGANNVGDPKNPILNAVQKCE